MPRSNLERATHSKRGAFYRFLWFRLKIRRAAHNYMLMLNEANWADWAERKRKSRAAMK